MTRILPSAVTLLAVFAMAGGARAEGPGWLERWLYNAREETRLAIEAADRDEVKTALSSFDRALRLEGESTITHYNAGTARLREDLISARALLESAAAKEAPSELAAEIHYNLGHTHLEEENYPGAIAAFTEALRQRGDFEDAKFNLELARRLLEEEEQDESQDSDEQEDQEQEEQKEKEQQQQEQPQDEPQENENQEGGEPPDPRQSPLPQFRDLPDMTAEEAAAILEAIENMEREKRREDALKGARTNALGKKDW